MHIESEYSLIDLSILAEITPLLSQKSKEGWRLVATWGIHGDTGILERRLQWPEQDGFAKYIQTRIESLQAISDPDYYDAEELERWSKLLQTYRSLRDPGPIIEDLRRLFKSPSPEWLRGRPGVAGVAYMRGQIYEILRKHGFLKDGEIPMKENEQEDRP